MLFLSIRRLSVCLVFVLAVASDAHARKCCQGCQCNQVASGNCSGGVVTQTPSGPITAQLLPDGSNCAGPEDCCSVQCKNDACKLAEPRKSAKTCENDNDCNFTCEKTAPDGSRHEIPGDFDNKCGPCSSVLCVGDDPFDPKLKKCKVGDTASVDVHCVPTGNTCTNKPNSTGGGVLSAGCGVECRRVDNPAVGVCSCEPAKALAMGWEVTRPEYTVMTEEGLVTVCDLTALNSAAAADATLAPSSSADFTAE